jgi:hypothetical protein
MLLQVLTIDIWQHVQGQKRFLKHYLLTANGRVNFYLELIVKLLELELLDVRGLVLVMVEHMGARGDLLRLATAKVLIEGLRMDRVRQARMRLFSLGK